MAYDFSSGSSISVTPSDSVDFPVTLGVWVGGAGNLHVTMKDGKEATYVGVQAGTMMPINVTRIWSTSTTATSIRREYNE
jgi:hypothetical protein